MNKRIALLIAFCGLGFFALQAQNIIRPKIACPNNIWVNSYNGVLFYQRADISVANRGMDLEAVFYYNSSANEQNYGYGNGWSLGNEIRYINDSLGVIIVRGDGRQDLYKRYGNSFEAPEGVFSTLSFEGTTYKLIEKDGTQYYFADVVSKCVTQEKDRYGNKLDYVYNNGNLISITDINGRSIQFTWSNDTLMTQINTSFDSRSWSYGYDENRNLTSVTDPMGATVRYAYNKDNRIKTFIDAGGYSTHISYNDDGQAHRVKTDLTDKSIRYELAQSRTVFVDYLPNGASQFSTYVWDEKGRVIEKVGNCCGFSSKLAYDDDNNVVRMEDANGNVTLYTYDSNGNMLTLTDPLGYTEQYTYEPNFNRIATYRDKNGNSYNFTYDDYGNITSIISPMNKVSRFTYDTYGQALTATDPNGHTVTYMYDNYGNRISETDALGNTFSMQYSISGLPISSTSPMQKVTYYTFNNNEKLTKIKDPLNFTTEYSYDERGDLTMMVDARKNAVSLTYDALGHTLSLTGPLGNTVRYTYNAKSKTTKWQDAMNGIRNYFYDDHDWVTMTIDEIGDTTFYYYDNVGNLVGEELPGGQILDYRYDALNRLVYVGDQHGAIEQYQYDANGNTIAYIDGNSDTVRVVYNALNWVTQIVDPLGNVESYAYDENGNIVTHTDATGTVTTYTYDAADRCIEEQDALGNITHFTYDANGNLSSVQDANGNTTSYQYDAKNRLALITFANGKTRQYWYDGNGNIIRQKDETDNLIEMEFDAMDHLVSRTYPDNSQDTFSYDLNGNVLTANNANASVSFSYDAEGKILSETLNGGTTRYDYNTRNNTINITYPGGRAIQEVYNHRGLLSQIKESGYTLTAFSYDAADRLVQRDYDNGLTAYYTYDADSRLKSIVEGQVMNLTMTYDAGGNMLAKINNLNASQSEQYQYDDVHRLIDFRKGLAVSAQIPNPVQHVQYALDALGNRTTTTENGIATQYSHNNTNAYTNISGGMNYSFQYDDNGNMINDGRHTYQYGYDNQMVSVDNGNTAIYKYDAFNRRIQKQVGNTITNYYYRGNQMIEERNGNNTVMATYIFGKGSDNVLQMKRNNQTYYYHKDLLGSVVAISNGSGNVVETYQYDVFGDTKIFNANHEEMPQSAIGNTYMFTSREMDFETGLYYFRARTLHADLGRFMQSDPYLYIDSYNYYTYVDNRPLYFIDANGTSNMGLGFLNMGIDFLIGGCLDLIDNWGCSSPGELLKNFAMCGLDIGSLIPGLQGLKGLKAANMVRKGLKAGKGGSKLAGKGNKLRPGQKPKAKQKNGNSGDCGGGGGCGEISNRSEINNKFNLENAQRKAGEENVLQNQNQKVDEEMFKKAKEPSLLENQKEDGLDIYS